MSERASESEQAAEFKPRAADKLASLLEVGEEPVLD